MLDLTIEVVVAVVILILYVTLPYSTPNLSYSTLLYYRYHNRTSSAHWDADELTLVEKRTYRKHMGYDKPAMVGGI